MLRALKRLSLGLGVAAVAFGGAAQAQNEPIKIGWTAWSDAEAVTKMAKKIIEERLDTEVELTLSDIAIQYQGVAAGDLDMMLMSWLPGTHADYMDKYGGEIVNLGPLYTGAKLGWVVPNYVPKDQVSSIEDLKKGGIAEKFDEKIQGIDPGAGLMRLSKKTVEDYQLDDYELVSASGAAMTAALERAVNRDEWIVVTGWSPHWMFAAHDLRYLEDPKGTLGGPERIHALARQDFYQDHPEVGAFLARFYIPLEELEAVMNKAQETSYEEAVNSYIENHKARVNYWVTGDIQSQQG